MQSEEFIFSGQERCHCISVIYATYDHVSIFFVADCLFSYNKTEPGPELLHSARLVLYEFSASIHETVWCPLINFVRFTENLWGLTCLHADLSDLAYQLDQPDLPDQSNLTNISSQSDQSDQSDQLDQSDQSDQSDQLDRLDQSDQLNPSWTCQISQTYLQQSQLVPSDTKPTSKEWDESFTSQRKR